jgi:hypothetical protein
MKRYYKPYNKIWIEIPYETYTNIIRTSLSVVDVICEKEIRSYTYGIAQLNYMPEEYAGSELVKKILDMNAMYIVYGKHTNHNLTYDNLRQGELFITLEEANRYYESI